MFYLVSAFMAVWVAVLLYVVYMASRQRHLQQELEILEELIQTEKKQATSG
jgi:CcmD family protein